jgi:hypothetical protein
MTILVVTSVSSDYGLPASMLVVSVFWGLWMELQWKEAYITSLLQSCLAVLLL